MKGDFDEMLGYWIVGQSQIFKVAMNKPCVDFLDEPIYREMLKRIYTHYIERAKLCERRHDVMTPECEDCGIDLEGKMHVKSESIHGSKLMSRVYYCMKCFDEKIT